MDASVAAVSRDLADGVVISAGLFILKRFLHANRYPLRSKTLSPAALQNGEISRNLFAHDLSPKTERHPRITSEGMLFGIMR